MMSAKNGDYLRSTWSARRVKSPNCDPCVYAYVCKLLLAKCQLTRYQCIFTCVEDGVPK